MNRSVPIIMSITIFLMAGCGYSYQHTAIPKKHSRPSAVGTNTPIEKTISYDGFSLRVPALWNVGDQVTDQIKIYKTPTSGLNAGTLLPKLSPDSGPGFSANPENKSPFFSEQFAIVSGDASLSVAEVGSDGYSYNLLITVPASEAPKLRETETSMRTPSVATATDDVKFIQRDAQEGVLSLTTAAFGSADRWLCVSGNPHTTGEQYALFRTTDGGNTWTLLHSTTVQVQSNFPGSLGEPSIFFWSATDGVLAVSSANSPVVWLYRTTDGGANFTPTTLSVPRQPSSAPTLSRSSHGVLFVTVPLGSGTYTATSTDNGKTWVASH